MSTPAALPDRIENEDHLEDLMSEPTPELVEDLKQVDGDIMVLGVGGKVGPTLARMAKRAAPGKRVIGVARSPSPAWRAAGIVGHRDDPLRPADPRRWPGCPGAQHRLHGRQEVRHQRRALVRLGDEHLRAGDGGERVPPIAAGGVLHAVRLSLRAGGAARLGRKRRARPAGRLCQLLRRPRARLRTTSRAVAHAGPPDAAELLHRHALRRAASTSPIG